MKMTTRFTFSIGTICDIEYALMIKKSGGQYVYLYEAWGPLVAFIYKWQTTVIGGPCGSALLMLTLARYAIGPFYPGCSVPQEVEKLTAAVCISMFNSCWLEVVPVKKNTTFLKANSILTIILKGGNFDFRLFHLFLII